jgi:hypothetical protein
MLSVKKKPDGKVMSVELTSQSGDETVTYSIVADDKLKDVLAKHNGKRVELLCAALPPKNEQKMLHAYRCKPVVDYDEDEPEDG